MNSVIIAPHSNPGLVLLLFWLYGIALICYGYIITTFFNSVKYASAVGSMVFYVMFAISVASIFHYFSYYYYANIIYK